MSTILPLASSPHCRPITQVPGIGKFADVRIKVRRTVTRGRSHGLILERFGVAKQPLLWATKEMSPTESQRAMPTALRGHVDIVTDAWPLRAVAMAPALQIPVLEIAYLISSSNGIMNATGRSKIARSRAARRAIETNSGATLPRPW